MKAMLAKKALALLAGSLTFIAMAAAASVKESGKKKKQGAKK